MDFVVTKRSARLLGIKPELSLLEANNIINRLSRRKRAKRLSSAYLDMETMAALVPLPANQRFVTEDEVTQEDAYHDEEGLGR